MGYASASMSTSRDYCSLAGGKLPAVPPRCASTTTEWLCHACCYDVPRMAQRTSSMLSGLRRTKILLWAWYGIPSTNLGHILARMVSSKSLGVPGASQSPVAWSESWWGHGIILYFSTTPRTHGYWQWTLDSICVLYMRWPDGRLCIYIEMHETDQNMHIDCIV